MTGNKKKRVLTPGIIITAFAAALTVFILLVYTEKKVTAEEEKIRVAVAGEELEKGEMLDLAGADGRIVWKEIPASLVPEMSFGDEQELGGISALEKITKGTIITEGMVENTDTVRSAMTDPVLVGFKAEDHYQTAGGKIREGDRIHIYLVGDEGETTLRWSDVYVADAYDAAGEEIVPGEEGRSLRYNIYIEKKDVEEFYENLDAKSIRVALSCRNTYR